MHRFIMLWSCIIMYHVVQLRFDNSQYTNMLCYVMLCDVRARVCLWQRKRVRARRTVCTRCRVTVNATASVWTGLLLDSCGVRVRHTSTVWRRPVACRSIRQERWPSAVWPGHETASTLYTNTVLLTSSARSGVCAWINAVIFVFAFLLRLFITLTQQSGTLCQMNLDIRTASGVTQLGIRGPPSLS